MLPAFSSLQSLHALLNYHISYLLCAIASPSMLQKPIRWSAGSAWILPFSCSSPILCWQIGCGMTADDLDGFYLPGLSVGTGVILRSSNSVPSLFIIARSHACYVTPCKPLPIESSYCGGNSLYCTSISFACKGWQIILGY